MEVRLKLVEVMVKSQLVMDSIEMMGQAIRIIIQGHLHYFLTHLTDENVEYALFWL